MFCPQCKVEYRRGFTRCSDCDIDLVYESPAAAHSSGEAGMQAENSEDPFCSFWRGDDPRIHAELCELLNEEGIPHKTIRREDHLFNLNIKSAFEIGIPFSQFPKAEAAIKNAYGTEQKQDATRLLPFAGSYAEDFRGVFPWRPALKGFAGADDNDDDFGSMAALAPEEPGVVERTILSRRDDRDGPAGKSDSCAPGKSGRKKCHLRSAGRRNSRARNCERGSGGRAAGVALSLFLAVVNFPAPWSALPVTRSSLTERSSVADAT